MKKVLVLSMALISAVSLTACGGGTAPTTAAATTGAATGAASSEAQEQGQDGGAAASGNWDNYELKLATNLAEDHVACQGYYAFAERFIQASSWGRKAT